MSGIFFDKDCETYTLEEGMVYRKLKASGGKMMMVEVIFEKNAVGKVHRHPHEQCTYIIEGQFEFTSGSKKYMVEVGDTLYFEPEVEHGCVCISQKGKVLDVFTPQREDFLIK